MTGGMEQLQQRTQQVIKCFIAGHPPSQLLNRDIAVRLRHAAYPIAYVFESLGNKSEPRCQLLTFLCPGHKSCIEAT